MTTEDVGATQRQIEPCRQVHLDFHTSEHIPGVGSKFDKAQWQQALKLSHVNLINLFAKGHHSWCYYPTQAGMQHPTLTRDLLGEQIEACHEIDVKAAAYITVGWSANDAANHPEWCCRTRDGQISAINVTPEAAGDDPRPICSWQNLCPNTAYHEQVMAHADEVTAAYDVDGLWLDIYYPVHTCFCDACLKGMADAGVDSDDDAAVMNYYITAVKEHQAKVRALLHSRHPQATIYFNGTTGTQWPETFSRELFEHNTKIDLEDLPTTWGGYNKFPLRGRMFHALGKPVVAMSGKFHTMWGEFGGFKHRDAIKYEAACMIANGARCNFGDQLHPCGEMDLSTYANIGHAFQYVEQIEAYGVPGTPVSNLAVWYTGNTERDEGVVSMLLETQTEFEVIRSGQQIAPHVETIVLPGGPCLVAEDVAALKAFIERGGKMLILGGGALDPNTNQVALGVGAVCAGPGEFAEDYTCARPAIGFDLPETPFLNYSAALRFAPAPGTKVLADIREPYFNRTYEHYCSHQNTPYRTEAAPQPAVFRKENIVSIAHDLAAMYHVHGARVHRQLFINCLHLLHDHPMLQTHLPSAGRATLLHQPHENRYVAHLTYAPPMRRGRCEIIEDIPPVYHIPVTVSLPETVKRIYTAPNLDGLEPDLVGDRLRVTVPRLECHIAVVFEY